MADAMLELAGVGRTFADGTRVLRTLLSEHRRADRRKARARH